MTHIIMRGVSSVMLGRLFVEGLSLGEQELCVVGSMRLLGILIGAIRHRWCLGGGRSFCLILLPERC